MKKIPPLVKGVITAVVMIGTSLLLENTASSDSNWPLYLFYLLYAGGVAWTLLGYYYSPGYKSQFGSIFNQGFRCFIMITLITVIYVGIRSSTRSPQEKQRARVAYQKDLDEKEKSKTPDEKEKMIMTAEKYFVTGQIQLAIFGCLVTGAVFTAAGSALLLLRKN